MKIKLKKDLKGDFEQVELEVGISLKELAASYQPQLPYTLLAAKVDNKFRDLNFILEKDSTVELVDMRTQGANLMYQNSLALIYLKSVEDVLGPVEVDIENSLNKGLYTTIKKPTPLTEEDVELIQKRMEEIRDLDLKIGKESVSPEEAKEIFLRMGLPENLPLISSERSRRVHFYSLEGHREFFYSLMVPSSGYIEHFKLMKYKNGALLRFPHPSKPDEIPPYKDEKVLYQAFGEQNRWGKLMGIRYVSDLNRVVEEGRTKELIQLSEALHEQKIVEIADMISREKKRIILIAGPSSSGKTTFAQRLCIQLRVKGLVPLYLGTDDYFLEREDTPLDEFGNKNYEDLEAVDVELFNRHMNRLLAGETVDLPTFDFIYGHKEFGKRLTSIRANQPIVIEGIHALNEALTADIDRGEKFKIYISPLTSLNLDSHNRVVTTDHRMLRRMVRDFKYRDRSAETTISGWPSVRKGEDKNIFPYSGEADVMFNSVHLYEIGVLKKYAEPLLKKIKPEQEEYADAVRMLSFLQFFKTIQEDSYISNNSILREFIGGSIFVE